MSHEQIRETVDLKPIGTDSNTDFDLYIKKLGCSVVIDKNPHEKPLGVDDTQSTSKPETLGNIRPNDKYDTTLDKEYNKPFDNGYLQSSLYDKKPSYGSVSNYYLPVKPTDYRVDKVQTMVSVADRPDSYYHPVHDIFLSNNNQYGNINDKIDGSYGGRPDGFYLPYENSRPDIGPPRPPYESKPPKKKPSGGYDRPDGGISEPSYSVHEYRPDCDRPDPPYAFRPERPSDYGEPPLIRPPLPPKPRPDSYDRPDPSYNRPIFPKPRPDGYDRPGPNYDLRPKPRPDIYDRPNSNYEVSPLVPKPRPDEYDRPDRPFDLKPIRPGHKPNEYDRPDSDFGLKPLGYYESHYYGYGSGHKYSYGMGMSNVDRYDVRPDRPNDL